MEICGYRVHGSGDCPNYEQMRADFVRRGDWLNCAGCCQMCKERHTCALSCEEVRQMSITDFTKEAKQ